LEDTEVNECTIQWKILQLLTDVETIRCVATQTNRRINKQRGYKKLSLAARTGTQILPVHILG
jgi:hypothetical protein